MPRSELIRMGETVDKGRGPGKILPFIYSFVGPSEYVDGTRVAGDDWEQYNGSIQAIRLLHVGVPLANNATRDRITTHYRKLDSDYHFKLKSIRYSVFQVIADLSHTYDPNGGTLTGEVIADQWNDLPGRAYRQDIKVSISLPSQQSRYLYGGDSTNQAQNPGDTIPIGIDVLEGNMYGQGQLRTPVLMPKNSTIRMDFHNRNPNGDKLFVTGCLIGVKVRI